MYSHRTSLFNRLRSPYGSSYERVKEKIAKVPISRNAWQHWLLALSTLPLMRFQHILSSMQWNISAVLALYLTTYIGIEQNTKKYQIPCRNRIISWCIICWCCWYERIEKPGQRGGGSEWNYFGGKQHCSAWKMHRRHMRRLYSPLAHSFVHSTIRLFARINIYSFAKL